MSGDQQPAEGFLRRLRGLVCCMSSRPDTGSIANYEEVGCLNGRRGFIQWQVAVVRVCTD